MKYLFYIAKVYSIPIIKPLVEVLADQQKDYRFFVSDVVKENWPDDWDKDLIVNTISESKKFNPDFVLCPGNFVDFRIPGLKVQIFHGLGVEKEVHYKIRHFFDIYMTSGPFVTERYIKMQKKYKYFMVIETGWPKIDYILNYDGKNVHKKLELPINKKIVLYAPTFSTQHESATALLEIIPKIIRNDEFWLFKFHELMDKNLTQRFRDIDPDKGRVLGNVDITPYLYAADVMISDTSSVVYEFMVLDKPVITYKTQAREDKGINIDDPANLRIALDRSYNDPDEFHDLRIKHLKEINPSLEGKISEDIFNKLEQVKVEKYFPKKGKPLNLSRKIQLIYHSLFKKGYLR